MTMLAHQLVARGHDVSVTCLAHVPDAVGSTTYDGISVTRYASQKVLGSVRSKDGFQFPDSDVLHLHGLWRHLARQFLHAGFGSGSRVVTLHGSLEGVAIDPNPVRRSAKLIWDWTAGVSLLTRFDAVVCLSDVEERHLRRRLRRLATTRVVVLPNPLPFAPVGFPADSHTSQSNGRLLFLGRIATQKNLPLLIRCLVENDDLPGCDIVGPVGDAWSEVQVLLKSVAPGRVRVLPETTGAAKWTLLRDSAALVLPSHWEGMSVAALEAISVGIPVVVSRRGSVGLPESAITAFDPATPTALATAIRRALAAPRRTSPPPEDTHPTMLTEVEYCNRIEQLYCAVLEGRRGL
jgi:glycosyltransferase involved in cell wall biosynthesis